MGMWRPTAVLLLASVFAACDSGTLDPLPLDVSVQANPATTVAGDSISFVIIAQGGSLVGVEADYGNGDSDLYGTGGARTARVTFRYAYPSPGTYTVRVTVTDAIAGAKEATTEVVVNE